MKRIKVIKNGVVTNQLDEDQYLKYGGTDINAWLAEQIASNGFGKPERWLNGTELTDAEKAQALESRVVIGSLGEQITEYKFAAEYTIVEEDITAEIAEKNRKAGVAAARKARLLALAQRVKANTITAAERNEVVGLLLLDLIKELD